MNTYTVRLYLFGYRGSIYTHPVMRLYWVTEATEDRFDAACISAHHYALRLMNSGECTGYHLAYGLN